MTKAFYEKGDVYLSSRNAYVFVVLEETLHRDRAWHLYIDSNTGEIAKATMYTRRSGGEEYLGNAWQAEER